MALMKCSECGREISDKAEACPGCGLPPFVQIYEAYEPFVETCAEADFINCEECGRELPNQATVCPECNAVLDKTNRIRMSKIDHGMPLNKDEIPIALYWLTAIVGFPFGTGYAVGSYFSQMRLINSGRYNEARRKIGVAKIVCWTISIPCAVIVMAVLRLATS